MKDRLTKTAYLNYLACPQEFWLDYHDPDLINRHVSTLEYEHLRQQGYLVQQLVKKLAHFRSSDAVSVEFERVFQTTDLYARCDAVVTDKETGIVDLYEIKSSASVKPEHLDDVTFQKMVADLTFTRVGRCYVITMNDKYIRRGEIDVEQLFLVTDVTEEVANRMADTQRQTREAIAYLDSVPEPSLIEYCTENKLDCRFITKHFPNLPDYTVFDIAFLKNDKRRDLLSQGIVAITDVPDDFPLSPKQRRQVDVAKSGRPEVNHQKIAERIDSWNYPLHFLDYETFSYAVPQFDGVRPFQQMCFQYSLHTIERPGDDPRHSFFLSRGDDDPPRSMAAKLHSDLSGDLGTIFVWYEAFEKTRNVEMGGMFPEFTSFFEEVNAHTVDLMKIFSDGLYIDPNFRGSSSIKKVLPVLVPELSYKYLGIGDGLTATISWFRAATWHTLNHEEREVIFNDLEEYCHLDTLAMVEIFRRMKLLTPVSLEFQAIG